MPAEIVAVVLVVAVVVLGVPVRRLILDGHSRWTVLGYVAVLLILAVGVTEARTLGRVLLPLLGLAYIAPFITLGPGIDRLLGRRRPVVRVSPVPTRAIAPPRNVTPDVPRDVRPAGDVAPDRSPGDEPTDGSRPTS